MNSRAQRWLVGLAALVPLLLVWWLSSEPMIPSTPRPPSPAQQEHASRGSQPQSLDPGPPQNTDPVDAVEEPPAEPEEVRCTPYWRAQGLAPPTNADALYVVPVRPTDSSLLSLGDEEPPESDKTPAWMEADDLVFPSSRGTPLVSLYINGKRGLVLGVREGRCSDLPFQRRDVPLDIEIYGVPENYTERVYLNVCGMPAHASLRERPVRVRVPTDPSLEGPCVIQASRKRGAFTIPGDPVVIPIPAEHEGPVVLNFPSFDPAGLGVSFEIDEEGAHLSKVWPSTPAHAAGLTEGDRILAVDDQEVQDMSNEDFQSWGLGPEGSEVRLRVLTAEGEQEITLNRAYLDL